VLLRVFLAGLVFVLAPCLFAAGFPPLSIGVPLELNGCSRTHLASAAGVTLDAQIGERTAGGIRGLYTTNFDNTTVVEGLFSLWRYVFQGAGDRGGRPYGGYFLQIDAGAEGFREDFATSRHGAGEPVLNFSSAVALGLRWQDLVRRRGRQWWLRH
jgi:hypothetical protein